jgi:hypothetical protein
MAATGGYLRITLVFGAPSLRSAAFLLLKSKHTSLGNRITHHRFQNKLQADAMASGSCCH